MDLSWISRFAGGVIGSVIAFLVALLPERIKKREPFAGFQSNTAHFFSGISESALALILFVYGYDQFVGRLSLSLSRALAAGSAHNIRVAEMGEISVLGFISYLLSPVALIALYMFVEGGVRAITASLAGRCHGIAVFWLIHKIAIFAGSKKREANLRKQLGPYEPDSCIKDGASGALVLTSIEEKNWRERQVAKYGDDFIILSTRNFEQKGKIFRYQYTFRHMHPGEIIRGTVVVIPSTLCFRAVGDLHSKDGEARDPKDHRRYRKQAQNRSRV